MSEADKRKPSILVVDDNNFLRSMFAMVANQEGYETLEASSGEECLIKYPLFQPDLILLDVIMPDMDGFTCCEKLREITTAKQVAILMITALDDSKSINRAFAAGADDYITKPINWEVLKQRIKRLMMFNQNLLEKRTLQNQLDKSQEWEIFIHQFLQTFHNHRSSLIISVETLTQIRVYLQVSRVICAIFNQPNFYLESCAIEGDALENKDLIVDVVKQIPDPDQIFITTKEQLDEKNLIYTFLTAIKSDFLLIVPVFTRNKKNAYLIIVDKQRLPKQEVQDIRRIQDIGAILALAMT